VTNSLYAESDGDLRMLILAWYRRARIANQAHAHAASRARHIKAFLGIPAVALSAIAGSAIFANIDKAPNKILQITAGVLTLTAAILAALQGFLKFDEQIQEHESASRAFGAIRRELGLVGAMTGQSREEKISLLDSIRKEYDQASAASRNVPERVWKRIADRSNVFWPPEFLAWPEVPGGR
jgi:hypothetical protein